MGRRRSPLRLWKYEVINRQLGLIYHGYKQSGRAIPQTKKSQSWQQGRDKRAIDRREGAPIDGIV